jgi:hypothetical protein
LGNLCLLCSFVLLSGVLAGDSTCIFVLPGVRYLYITTAIYEYPTWKMCLQLFVCIQYTAAVCTCVGTSRASASHKLQIFIFQIFMITSTRVHLPHGAVYTVDMNKLQCPV